jgi:hypothetical protein
VECTLLSFTNIIMTCIFQLYIVLSDSAIHCFFSMLRARKKSCLRVWFVTSIEFILLGVISHIWTIDEADSFLFFSFRVVTILDRIYDFWTPWSSIIFLASFWFWVQRIKFEKKVIQIRHLVQPWIFIYNHILKSHLTT